MRKFMILAAIAVPAGAGVMTLWKKSRGGHDDSEQIPVSDDPRFVYDGP
ncbi:MAG TPA: hypothetical protein VN697_03215 [Tepidiformaceae bacterium]|nr:hypothetical protein [Tepidiformaceae bacterium]